MTRRTQGILRVVLVLTSLVMLVAVTLLLTLQSDWFRERVRKKIVSVVEDATGGRVEIGAFTYDRGALTAEVSKFVLHGKELPSEAPLFRADSIQVGLRVVSLLRKQVDVASLVIKNPQISITDGPAGTNLPSPKIRPWSKGILQTLLDLKVRRFSMSNGWAEFNFRRVPLDIRTENLNARFAYNSLTRRYTGELSSRALHLQAAPIVPDASFDVQSRMEIDSSSIHVQALSLVRGNSRIDLTGKIDGFPSPVAILDVKADVRPEDLNRPFHVPLADSGAVAFVGKAALHLAPEFDVELTGNATGRGLAYHSADVNVANATVSSSVRLNLKGVSAPNFVLHVLDGSIRGHLELTEWKKLSIAGEVQGIPIQAIASLAKPRVSEINGRATGPVSLEATIVREAFENVVANAKVKIEPGNTGIPVRGFADVKYRQADGMIQLGNSTVDVGSTHMEISGVVGQALAVRGTTNNLQEALAALPLAGQPIPANLPVTLKGGTARFEGAVNGPLTNPRIAGRIDLTSFNAQGQDFDHLAGNFDLTSSQVSSPDFSLTQGPLHLQARGQIGLVRWQVTDASPVTASISLRGAEIGKILEQRKWKVDATGVLAATAEVKGTLNAPQASAGIDAENVTAYGEHINRLRASVILSGNTLQVIDGRISAPSGELHAAGTFEHAKNDWGTGQFRFDLNGRGLALGQVAHVQKIRSGISGSMDVAAHGTASLKKSEFRVQTINSETHFTDLALEGRRYGSAAVFANNHGTTLELRADAKILNTPVQAKGEWKLEGDDPGQRRHHDSACFDRDLTCALTESTGCKTSVRRFC